mgnify:CR=1 FL=1
MKLNLSSQIVLNQIPEEFYRPATAIERSEITRFEKVPTDIFPTIEEGTIDIVNQLEADIKKREQEGRKYVMGVGSGSSLTPIFQELIKRHQTGKLSFKNVVIFNAYEYFPLSVENVNRSINQLKERFLNHIDIDAENIFTPDGTIAQNDVQEHCRQYEQHIKEFGGLDVILLGIGRMGNIATNEPGSSITSASRLILIDETSREEMKMSFGSQESVPPCSITMGVSTILSARKIFLTAWGEEKADIIKETVEGKITDAVPASFLQTHNNAHVVIDLSAAAKLTRIQHPWLVASCKWTDKLVRSALVWLCQITGKPILKLTNKDYNENGLSELLALYGSAYNANIKIFNDLQHTITGWPGGKPNADDTNRPEREHPHKKRVIIFSPHPDDDVISMGGTFDRLVSQGHEVHIAYQTSGNFAVSDHEALKFAEVFKDIVKENKGEVAVLDEIISNITNKKSNEIDTLLVRQLKGNIRRHESLAATRYEGVPDKHVHFLNLPFYETGGVKKNPIGEADINIIMNLIEEVKPHQIYAAGDLADPHGTHKVCLDAIFAALKNLKHKDYMKDCWVWLYRGAWHEWDIHEIEMAVPMSPAQVLKKRQAIFFHQSQKDGAMFQGDDLREFWQRAEARNSQTAQRYRNLGLADYEAIEAFKRYFF